jgi:hypothetical protein
MSTHRIPSFIELRVIGLDEDYSMLTFSVADGQFAGATELYGVDAVAASLASGLQGFPDAPTDVRDFSLGSRDERVAGGWLHFTCRCLDRAGHPVIEVELFDKYAAYGLAPRTAHIHLRVEAPAIDSFVLALRSWRIELGSSVALFGAT